ncbi:MAG TPA: hypothetical protein VF595_13340 [Tepidisphaeraceae bacterium]|jgi:hypothetical protein
MNDMLIFNASPNILLAKADLFWRATRLTKRVLTTQEVISEITARPEDADVRELLKSTPRLEVVGSPTGALTDTNLIEWNLGLGETSILAAATTRGDAEVVLDDRAARRAAKALAIPCVGTLGLLKRARQRSLIPSFHKAVALVLAAGLYMSPQTVKRIEAEFED